MYPINLSDDVLARLAGVFGCQTGSLPFTYLGIPVGTTRPKMVDFLPLVDCMERRLSASSCFQTREENYNCLTLFFHPCQYIIFALFISLLGSPTNWKEFRDNAYGESLERTQANHWQHGIWFVSPRIKVDLGS